MKRIFNFALYSFQSSAICPPLFSVESMSAKKVENTETLLQDSGCEDV